MIKLLPVWVFPDTLPSVYDRDSGTCIEMTAKVYGAMRDLQTEYNKFASDINTKITEFINSTNQDQEEFKNCINKLVHNYIMMLDEKINKQDLVIANAVDYMKTNLPETVRGLLVEMFESNELTIDFTYNPTTESLDLTGVVVHERSES